MAAKRISVPSLCIQYRSNLHQDVQIQFPPTHICLLLKLVAGLTQSSFWSDRNQISLLKC